MARPLCRSTTCTLAMTSEDRLESDTTEAFLSVLKQEAKGPSKAAYRISEGDWQGCGGRTGEIPRGPEGTAGRTQRPGLAEKNSRAVGEAAHQWRSTAGLSWASQVLSSLPLHPQGRGLTAKPKGSQEVRDPSANRALQVQRTRGWQGKQVGSEGEIPTSTASRSRDPSTASQVVPAPGLPAIGWGLNKGIKIHPPGGDKAASGAGRQTSHVLNPPNKSVWTSVLTETNPSGENLRLPGSWLSFLLATKAWQNQAYSHRRESRRPLWPNESSGSSCHVHRVLCPLR